MSYDDYMTRRTYDDLDEVGQVGNSVEWAFNAIKSEMRGLYPDSWATEPRISTLEDLIEEFELHAAEYVNRIRKLISEDRKANSK
jgi:hypothetical protein